MYHLFPQSLQFTTEHSCHILLSEYEMFVLLHLLHVFNGTIRFDISIFIVEKECNVKNVAFKILLYFIKNTDGENKWVFIYIYFQRANIKYTNLW